MAVHGGFFEITGSFEELAKIEKGIQRTMGRLTASDSASCDLWLEMREEWIRVHTREVLQRAQGMATSDPLICPVCWNSIAPDQLRFKAWRTDEEGNTIDRQYVHLYHVTDSQEI